VTHTESSSRRSFLGMLPAGALAVAALAPRAAASEVALRHATVLFVRHAETDGPSSENPGLSEQGRARAAGLAGLLSGTPVTAVFATELKRTGETMEPVAEQAGLTVETYAAREPGGFVEQLEELGAGEVIVVAGHSNTVPKMVELLGGSLEGLDQWGYLPETEHDRVIVQTLVAAEPGEPLRALQTLDLRLSPAE